MLPKPDKLISYRQDWWRQTGNIGLAVAASMLLLAASFVVLYAVNHRTARKAAS